MRKFNRSKKRLQTSNGAVRKRKLACGESLRRCRRQHTNRARAIDATAALLSPSTVASIALSRHHDDGDDKKAKRHDAERWPTTRDDRLRTFARKIERAAHRTAEKKSKRLIIFHLLSPEVLKLEKLMR